MYDDRRSGDVSRMDGVRAAHMACTASSGDWARTIFRTQLMCDILYDDFRARCDGSYMWIYCERQRRESVRDVHISRMDADEKSKTVGHCRRCMW